MAWGHGRSSYGSYSRGGGSYSRKSTAPYTKPKPKKAGPPLPHKLEYAITGKAKCRGAGGCDSLIDCNALRYGKEEASTFEEGTNTTIWTHWGCVTAQTLKALKAKKVTTIPGFNTLRPVDQSRVKADVEAGYITIPSVAAAAPSTANAVASSSAAPNPAVSGSQSRKRKEPEGGAFAPPMTQIVAEEDLDTLDEDIAADEPDEVYIAFPTKIVGVRYYTGMVGAGELVSVVREPTNQYDSNAIRALNASGTQVGHLPRTVASRLAPLMDQDRISVEGIMISGNLTGRFAYELNMTLNICGPSNPRRRAELEPLLVWATPGQRGFVRDIPANQTGVQGTSLSPKKGRPQAVAPSASQAGPSRAVPHLPTASQKAAELGRMMAGLAKVDDSARRATVLDALCGEDILELPLHEDPPSVAKGLLKNDLLKHQSQGLRWCIEHEYPQLPGSENATPVQFWQMRKNGAQTYYYNIATKTPQVQAPILGRGAIMADSMGLGKTLTMIALILATLADVPAAYSNATLIVVPLSVLSNWTTQLQDHVIDGQLSAYVYHGDGRSIPASALTNYTVVLTTYDMVSSDWKGLSGAPAKKKPRTDGGLFGVKWKRVILDEGHNIRNPKAKTSQAVCGLDAERRWIVTGTPIINSPTDLGSLLKFLRVCTPLDQHDYFNRLLARPLAKADPAAADLLKALMSSACIRRTKEMRDKEGKPLVPLPPVEVSVVRVTLNEVERTLYDNVFAEAQKRFNTVIRAAGVTNPQAPAPAIPMGANVLSMLTRLRQLALHSALVPDNYLEELRQAGDVGGNGAPLRTLDTEARQNLQYRLFHAMQEGEECSVCFDQLNNPRILPCAHYFCFDCIREVIARQQLCPMDRNAISEADLIEAAPPPVEVDDADSDDWSNKGDDDEPEPVPTSSKIQHLVSLLKLIPSTEKSLVFSQYTSFLNLIATQLDKEGIPYVRFDGSMPQRRRAQVLDEFSVPLEAADDTESDDEAPVRTRSSKGKGKAIDASMRRRNPVVMLISLKAGALGLNLTVASRVFLMDPWWQSAIELQAIDRVNRIGQTKNVHVYQMVAENTVEARVLGIQERKQLLVEQAFSGTRTNATRRKKNEVKLTDLMELFANSSQVPSA